MTATGSETTKESTTSTSAEAESTDMDQTAFEITSPDAIMVTGAEPVIAERFRRLRTTLSRKEHAPAQVIVVTSPVPRDGKSFTALNLALAFAEYSESKTLLIDADLRRPRVRQFVEPAPERGLIELLAGKARMEEVLHRPTNSKLHILPTAHSVEDPTVWLSSMRFKDLLRLLRDVYKRIIIDSPPVVPFADADLIGHHADGFMLVVRSEQTLKSLYKQSVEAIKTAKIFGTVINGPINSLLDRDRRDDSYYYDYYKRK